MPGKDYIIDHNFHLKAYGTERRRNITKEILDNGTPLPLPIQYHDIDDAFKKYVDEELGITYDGKKLPTIVLLSNQRFSEYAQTWQYVDDDKNMLMNFKTITRENNPKPGQNQGGYWNIPGERFYTVTRVPVLDKNGTESLLIYKMKQPYCVDIFYELSIFTSKYELLNEFNQMVVDRFKSRQCYIRPNGHFLPMLLEDISDDSEYNIDDRKFFSQSFQIKALGYIINPEDLDVSQVPLRTHISFLNKGVNDKKPKVEVEDVDVMNKEVNVNISFPPYENKVKFDMDADFDVTGVTTNNIRNFRLHINNNPIYTGNGFKIKNGDELRIKINAVNESKEAMIVFNGIDKTIALTDIIINPESMLDAKEGKIEYEINNGDI